MSTILHTIMKDSTLTPFYLSLLEFLLLAKQHLITIGLRYDLTSTQVVTLMLIDADNPRPMKDLGKLFHCDASNVTGIVDGLESRQLVSRRSDPEDRRIKTICLEQAGIQLQQRIAEQLGMHGFPLESLTPAEKRQLLRIMEKLTTASTFVPDIGVCAKNSPAV